MSRPCLPPDPGQEKGTDLFLSLSAKINLSPFPGQRGKQGLGLRPPKQLLRLLHLIREHAAAVAFRPISLGNVGYLEERVRELHLLGETLAALVSALRPEWQAKVTPIRQSLAQLSVRHRQRSFATLVGQCDTTRYRQFWEEAAVFIPAHDLPLLRRNYERVLVITGPGIGLGDEIACVDLVRSLKARWPLARFDFFGYYPGLWEAAMPGALMHPLAGRPLWAFDCVDEVIASNSPDRTLVLFVNFSGLAFHLAFCQDRVRPDMVEIAVGKGTLWFVPADGGPIEVVQAMDRIFPDNYAALRSCTEALLGPGAACEQLPEPLAPGLGKKDFRLVLSPFTSKAMFLSPQDWFAILHRSLSPLAGKKAVLCEVLPGLSDYSRGYAGQIVEAATQNPIPGCTVRLLGEHSEPEDGPPFARVYEGLTKADMLLGIDTFTAHLAAFLSVPSVTLTYERNTPFWPPRMNSFWVETRHDLDTITACTSLVFCLAGGLEQEGMARFRASWGLPDCTALAARLETEQREGDASRQAALIAYLDALWQALPPRCQGLIEKLDYNHAWPRVSGWLLNALPEHPAATWLMSVQERSHLRKLGAMLANLETEGRRP